MAFLDNIVNTINKVLKAKLTAFPKTFYGGLAYPIARKKDATYEFIPALILSDGETRYMTFEDNNELSIYHRIISSSYSQNREKSYGDGYTAFTQNYDVELVVMADRRKIKIEPDVLEAAIASNIPVSDTISGIKYINIFPLSANHNSRSVFSQEFQGLDYYLKPEHILFSIRYRVQLEYTKGCLSLCQWD